MGLVGLRATCATRIRFCKVHHFARHRWRSMLNRRSCCQCWFSPQTCAQGCPPPSQDSMIMPSAIAHVIGTHAQLAGGATSSSRTRARAPGAPSHQAAGASGRLPRQVSHVRRRTSGADEPSQKKTVATWRLPSAPSRGPGVLLDGWSTWNRLVELVSDASMLALDTRVQARVEGGNRRLARVAHEVILKRGRDFC